MEHINNESLKSIISKPVEIAILDEESEEQPSFLKKIVNKIEMCPDKTHVRIYFDHVTFFAIPVISTITKFKNEWRAYDGISGLYYVIREV